MIRLMHNNCYLASESKDSIQPCQRKIATKLSSGRGSRIHVFNDTAYSADGSMDKQDERSGFAAKALAFPSI